MRVATYNVNSIRMRLDVVLGWLREWQPDILALQETKCPDNKFPADVFHELGYQCALNGHGGRNGVAIISKLPAQGVLAGFGDPSMPEDGRLIAARVGPVGVACTYVPNGTAVNTPPFDYKLQWLGRFNELVAKRMRPENPILWMGDINIAPTPDDVYDSQKVKGGIGHHPREFEALDRLLQWGWVDCFRKFTQGPGHYTYWDYFSPAIYRANQGWRIDHIYASPALAQRCTACGIDRGPREADVPSDHTVVWADFDIA